jgi:teichuronic acid biosynthesis glycosyltransferase TuaH
VDRAELRVADGEVPWVVWMAAVSLDAIRGTDWHLANSMTAHARVLWVDPPISPLTRSARVARRAKGGRLLGPLTPRLTRVSDRFTRLTPISLPGLTRPGIRLTTTPLVRAQVRSAVKRMRIKPTAVVATHLGDVLGRFGADVVNVLYATDDYVAGASLMGLSAGRLRRQEQTAVGRVDIVAAVSPDLAAHWAALGAHPIVLPNGCKPSAKVTVTGNGQAQTIASGLASPVVGLVGQLSERIDIDILEGIADAGLSLLLVGPHDARWAPERFTALIARPQVHYAGQVPAEEVPRYLAAVDVGVTPYQDSAFNRASFPLKTLEYLGAGLPVVSTDLPAAHWLREQGGATDRMLLLASGREEFAKKIWQLANERVDGDAQACQALADQHSWARRAETLAELIGLTRG